jgi:hypothetical protein
MILALTLTFTELDSAARSALRFFLLPNDSMRDFLRS